MKETLLAIDRLIVQGELAEAQLRIKKRIKASVARSDLARVAYLAWRAGVPEVGLRLLRRVVRGAKGDTDTSTEEERAEYAQCLLRVGATDEGERMLQGIDRGKVPRAHLYQAGLEVSRWEYGASIAPLLSYLKTPGLSQYQQLVAKTNLAAAKVREKKIREAEVLLRELLYTTSLRKYRLLLGRVLELSAESYVVLGRWEAAEKFLVEAGRKLGDSIAVDAFFVK